jgi:hypothetical protein
MLLEEALENGSHNGELILNFRSHRFTVPLDQWSGTFELHWPRMAAQRPPFFAREHLGMLPQRILF